MLGDMWKNLPGEEKQKYYSASEVDKDRHTKETENYINNADIRS